MVANPCVLLTVPLPSWIWVFGFRYRTIVRSWERNIGTGMEQSVNWSGMALGAF